MCVRPLESCTRWAVKELERRLQVDGDWVEEEVFEPHRRLEENLTSAEGHQETARVLRSRPPFEDALPAKGGAQVHLPPKSSIR